MFETEQRAQHLAWHLNEALSIIAEEHGIIVSPHSNKPLHTNCEVCDIWQAGRQALLSKPKFNVGDKVRVYRLDDTFTNPDLIGIESTIAEVDPLPNGDYNYTLASGNYMHEGELELVEPV